MVPKKHLVLKVMLSQLFMIYESWIYEYVDSFTWEYANPSVEMRCRKRLCHYKSTSVRSVLYIKTTTITLKCQLHCMLKLAMQLIICMLQDSGAHFPHLKSVNLSMLNSSVKRDVYQLRGLYHVGNEPCSVLIKHVVLPGIFQVRLTVLPEYH